MKTFDLPRGDGKTTRLLYASEFNNAAILCLNEKRKKLMIDRAKELDLCIPDPITVNELTGIGIPIKRKSILVDEAIDVLSYLLAEKGFNIIGSTLTSDMVKINEKVD